MKEEKKLDLDNPIFVHYVNTEGMSRQNSNDLLDSYSKMVMYSNITNWIIPSNHTKVECIYDGKSKIRNLEISNIIKEINKRIDILSESKSFEDFKMNIREWRLSEIINESETNQED